MALRFSDSSVFLSGVFFEWVILIPGTFRLLGDFRQRPPPWFGYVWLASLAIIVGAAIVLRLRKRVLWAGLLLAPLAIFLFAILRPVY